MRLLSLFEHEGFKFYIAFVYSSVLAVRFLVGWREGGGDDIGLISYCVYRGCSAKVLPGSGDYITPFGTVKKTAQGKERERKEMVCVTGIGFAACFAALLCSVASLDRTVHL